MIGIMVVTPFAMILLKRRNGLQLSAETFPARRHPSRAGTGVPNGRPQFQLFYVLFLPIVWMAVRSGMGRQRRHPDHPARTDCRRPAVSGRNP
jgi:hypothetical protein